MRVSRVHQSLLCSLVVIILLTCVATTSSHANLLPRDRSSRLKRSLPGSLAIAPAGAVGYYQPPPGPIADHPRPTVTLGLPPKTTTTAAREIMHELRQVSATVTNRPDHNTATVTATATITQRAMAADIMAGKGRALNGLFLAILISVLHL